MKTLTQSRNKLRLAIPEENQARQTYRYFGSQSPTETERTPIKAQLTAAKDGNVAVIRLYDPIDSWGGYWGISAKEFVKALDEVGDVKTVQLRINSPGGDT